MRLRTLALLAAVPLTGCYPFITTGTYTESFCELDEDGDGAVKCEIRNGQQVDVDCDDTPDSEIAPLRFPDNTEVSYDGVDNDCVGGDLLDADNDGYPGISRADYEALGRGGWPSGLPDEVDCDDDDPDINPGVADTPYDGVDSDCADDCDYDVDGDGFADRRQGQDNDCGLEATDCLDSDADIYPEAPGEVFYDGEDQDCDGVNDFDPDGDGEAWAGYEGANATFLSRYGYDDTITAYTDCYDEDDAPLPSGADALDPIVVNASVAELFYDGVDGNCSDLDEVVQNDFDRDGDGSMRTADRADFLAYVDRYVNYEKHDGTFPYKAAFENAFGATSSDWADYFDDNDNDCNDANADVRPGALEKLGDSVDQDCDGGVDTTPFAFGGFTWQGVGNPMVRATSNDFIVTAVATEGIDFGSGLQSARVGALSFGLTATNATRPTQEVSPSPSGSGDTFSPGLGMVAFDDGYYIGHAFTRSGRTRLLGVIAQQDTSGDYSDFSRKNSDRVDLSLTYENTDMRCDSRSGSCWVVGCDSSGVQYAEYSDSENAATFDTILSGDAEVSNVDCFIATEATAGTFTINTIASSGAVTAWEIDGAGFARVASSNPFSGFDLDHASSNGDWLVLGNESRGITLWRSTSTQRSVLRSTSTDQADVSFLGSTAYLGAVGGSSLHLAYGNPAGSLTEVTVPFQDADGNAFTPAKVSIEASGSRVLMVVTGRDSSGDDVLGWAFFEI